MTAADLKIAGAVFLALTVSVGINLFALQDRRAGSAIETSAIGFTTPPPLAGPASSSDLGPPLPPGTARLRIAPPIPVAANTAPAGNSSEIIRGIQRELNARGYDAGSPDGVAGIVTRAAIMAFEHDYGMPLTAAPTQDLLSRIVLGSSSASTARNIAERPSSPDADAVIRLVEQQLAARGYTPGKVDGMPDDQLARAIREFEVDQKLPESGRISGQLVSRLTRLQGQGVSGLAVKSKSVQQWQSR
jgi:peptidoglycan hydrolase-like protein with peptidoglycan-binding domain